MNKSSRVVGEKLEESDFRVFDIKYSGNFFVTYIQTKISQLDLLKIIKALERTKNQRISTKFKTFITKIDEVESNERSKLIETNFKRKLPRKFDALLRQ